MRKGLRILIIAGALSIASTMSSFAGWEQVGTQWKYSDNGGYLTGWQWIDGNGDGVAECYYLDGNGVMAVNTSIEGYTVDANGAWTVDGVIQTKIISVSQPSTNQQTQPSGNYRRPLRGDDEGCGSDSSVGSETGGFGQSGGNKISQNTAPINGSQSNGGGTSNSGSSQSNGSSSSSKQQHGGVPDLDDIICDDFGYLDGDVQSGDSTGLPPMH